MNSGKIRLWSAPILILACVLGGPSELEAQCAVINTVPVTFPTFPSFMRITKTLSAPGNCTTASSNAFGCARVPAATMATMLVASAFTATTNPFCNWVCNCGPFPYSAVAISTNSGDGLPVELMDFSIEDGETAENDGKAEAEEAP